jgi:hypothetical protein
MNLEVPLSLEPMEAASVSELPPTGEWQYEPKVDGFRCIMFRDDTEIHLQSRRQNPLGRYFPEVVAAGLSSSRKRFVLDGELVIPEHPFHVLQLRLHPSPSRVARLSVDHPAQFVAFDLLADAGGRSLLKSPFSERRVALEQFFHEIGPQGRRHFLLSKATRSPAIARTWLKRLGRGLDGIVVKRLDIPYRPGKRAMQKFKVWQTVDCVVGGLYLRPGGLAVEYLLMGLYDREGNLNYVGRCGLGDMDGAEVAEILHPLVGGPGFTGRAPGGKSRWSSRDRQFIPLQPKLVAEVSADHIEGARFRHGSRLLRWRTDKAPVDCTMDQITQGPGASIKWPTTKRAKDMTKWTTQKRRKFAASMSNPEQFSEVVFRLQIASAFLGFISALLWWRSAALRAPPAICDGGKNFQEYMDKVSFRNQLAAGVTGFSIIVAAVGTLIARLWPTTKPAPMTMLLCPRRFVKYWKPFAEIWLKLTAVRRQESRSIGPTLHFAAN